VSRRARIPALALDDLEAWLAAQPDIARRNWTVSSIDGFATALAVGPERVPTDDWLRVIFGPGLPTTPMGLGAVSAVLDHANKVPIRRGPRLTFRQRLAAQWAWMSSFMAGADRA
jgi:uncharacterized protein